MNIIFLTLSGITDINHRGIYSDLMRKFRDEGHQVTIVSQVERRYKQKTQLIKQENISVLNVKTLNILKTNFIEKGIGTLLLEQQYKQAIKKNLKELNFDLIICSTPPITLTSVIESLKKKTGAMTYLLLKDIFPQNAVDLGMIRKGGLLHRFFRKKEKKLYSVSDKIGCMSPANVDFLLGHNPEISPEKVEVNPNSIELTGKYLTENEKIEVRREFNIPPGRTVLIYGGNLGKPQGIDFLTDVIKANEKKDNAYFLVVGSGTEFARLSNWFNNNRPENAKLIEGLPKVKYDQLVQSCDVGLIFLDKRFTIPNFPSRLLSYLEYKMPVLIATDENSDMGKIAEENEFGLYSVHGDIVKFNTQLEKLAGNQNRIEEMGKNGYHFLLNNYTVEHSYKTIMNHFKKEAAQSSTLK